MSTAGNKAAGFPGVKDGDTFEVAGIEFIKFPDKDGMTPVVSRNILFNSRFGNNNDLSASDVLKRLKDEVLPKICAAIGEENVCAFQTDLTAWDGLQPYGAMEEKISLPTMDFYRENVAVFDKYPVKAWWWLATPETAPPHGSQNWILCVSPRGRVNFGSFNCGHVFGVRPVLFFKSSIFGSSEE